MVEETWSPPSRGSSCLRSALEQNLRPGSRAFERTGFCYKIDKYFSRIGNYPIKILLPDGATVSVRRAVHKIDGVGGAAPDSKLDRIHVVSQRAAQRQGIFVHPLFEPGGSRWRIRNITEVMGLSRIIGHDAHARAAKHITTVVLREIYRFLRHHAQVPGPIVSAEERLQVFAAIDILPTPAIGRLEKDWKAQVGKHLIPVHETKIAERCGLRVRRVLLMRKKNSSRHRH